MLFEPALLMLRVFKDIGASAFASDMLMMLFAAATAMPRRYSYVSFSLRYYAICAIRYAERY